MSNEINNESSDYYENASSLEQNNRQRECLLQSFLKINKNENSPLTKEEVNVFFEEEGIIAPNLVSKLIAGIFQHEDVLTVNQFITNFLSLQKELKITHDNTLSKVQQKKLAIARYEKKLNEFKNETLDENGLGPEANVKIEVLDCNMTKVGHDECQIKIRMNDKEYTTNKISSEMKMMNVESCTFKPQTKEDTVFFVLYGKKSIDDDNSYVELGSIEFSLNEMNKQEEYEIDLTIPDEQDKIVGEIKIKILFIYSHYEYYEELITEEKKGLDTFEKNVQKSKGYLDQIHQIKAIKSIGSSQKEEGQQPQSRQYQNQNYNENPIKQPSTNVESDPHINMYSNNNNKMVNEAIKQEPSKQNDKSLNNEGGMNAITDEETKKRQLTIYLLYSWIGICLFNFLIKAEYVSALIVFMTYLNVRYNFNIEYTKQLLMAIGGCIALDILWMIVSAKGVWHGSVLGKITSILVPIGLLIKGGVLFKMINASKKQT